MFRYSLDQWIDQTDSDTSVLTDVILYVLHIADRR